VNLPLAAVGAVLAALLEASVLPELSIAGAKPDVVLVMAIVAVLWVGLEEGLVWAFLGGVMLDLIVSSERPLGTAIFALLVSVGMAIAVTRVAGQHRRLAAVLVALTLTVVYQGLTQIILQSTTGLAMSPFAVQLFGITAVLNALLTFLVATLVQWYLVRYPSAERTEWLSA